MIDPLEYAHWQEWTALAFFIACWFGYAHYSELRDKRDDSLFSATNKMRLNWMREMVARENRSVDSIIVGNLTRSFTFFASTSIFVIAALVSMLGYRERVNAVLVDIPFARLSDGAFWQMKIFLLIIIFVYAFFKFTWSMRQYNYVNMFIGSVPDYRERKDEHEAIAQRGAKLTVNAARHFNNGLRAYYFGVAALAWVVHPYLFIMATMWVVHVTNRREFRSQTMKILNG
ncbi:MAG: DUF599 domain-containing protein [Rickettsiales bacterium]|jgi:uncharacterized membrane protein|nr:DUF599 domain-containing protein [Rickettsiales bacterium]